MPIEQRDGYRLWEGGPVPKGADGITLGSLVIVREGKATPYLLRHELVHVRQWRRYGVFGFGVRYLGSYLLWRLRRKRTFLLTGLGLVFLCTKPMIAKCCQHIAIAHPPAVAISSYPIQLPFQTL